MKILSIETSCEQATVALLLEDELVQCGLEGRANHSERLLPVVQDLLDQSGIALGDLAAIAFGAGPGAFTGLRLACGVAQGLAMGADLGLVPVCSLAAVALRSGQDRVLVAIDARMGEVYSAAYHVTAEGPQEVQGLNCHAPSAVRFPDSGPWYAAGTALRAYPDMLGGRLSERLSGWDEDLVPRAGEVARIARLEVRLGRVIAPEQAGPLYIRDKVALTTAERLARGGRA